MTTSPETIERWNEIMEAGKRLAAMPNHPQEYLNSSFPARFSSYCKVCNNSIKAGTEAVFLDKKVVHFACGKHTVDVRIWSGQENIRGTHFQVQSNPYCEMPNCKRLICICNETHAVCSGNLHNWKKQHAACTAPGEWTAEQHAIVAEQAA